MTAHIDTMRAAHLACVGLRRCVALLLVLGCHAYATEATGRLFYTPAERAQLDAAKAAPEHAPPTYQGIVRRSQGPATVWIDGAPQDGRPPENRPTGHPASDPLLKGGHITVHPPRDDRKR